MLHPMSDTVERNSDLKPPQELNPTPQECPDTEAETRSFKFEVEDKGFLDLLNDIFSGEWL